MALLNFWPFNRKSLELSVPGASPRPPLRELGPQEDAAPTLPIAIDTQYEVAWRKDRDAILELTADGYKLLRRSPIVFQPNFKVAQELCALDLVAVSPNRPGSARQLAFQEMLDQTPGLPNCIEWFALFRHEGVTFYQIKLARARETGNKWLYPDLLDGGVHKRNAVDDANDAGLDWDREIIAKRRTYSALAPEKANAAASYSPVDFIIFACGSTTSSEGNLTLARVLVSLASQYEEIAKDIETFAHRFGVPLPLAFQNISSVRPDKVNEMLTGVAREVASRMGAGSRTNQPVGMPMDQAKWSLLEPQGNAAQILLARMQHLEGQAHRILLGNDLTSTTQGSGPSGSSQLQGGQQNNYVMGYGRRFCDDFSPRYVAWVDRNNQDFPKLADGEGEIYFQFQPHGKRQKLGLPAKAGVEEIDTEQMAAANTEPDDAAEGAAGEMGGSGMGKPDMMEMRRASLTLQKKNRIAKVLRLIAAGEHGKLRLISAITPPAHENCRCVLGPDDVWTDASDSRVCTQCLTLGAAWNLALDVPVGSAEVDEALDASRRKDFLDAIKSDSATADRVIVSAAEKAESGIIKNVSMTPSANVPELGLPQETLTNRLEKAIVKETAGARAKAAIPMGARLGGTPIPEAVEIKRIPPHGRVKPEFVTVTVAGNKQYEVIKRVGRYYVRDTATGKTLYSGENLAMMLLLFGLLTKKREAKQEEKDIVAEAQ